MSEHKGGNSFEDFYKLEREWKGCTSIFDIYPSDKCPNRQHRNICCGACHGTKAARPMPR